MLSYFVRLQGMVVFTGEYVGFDENEPTSETGGKKKVMETLKKKFGYK